MFLVHTQTSGQIFSDFWQKNFPQSCQTAFYAFREYSCMENSFFSKILFRLTSELQEKLFQTIGKIFTEKLSKLFSTCSGKNWRNSFFKKFLFFCVYSDFKRNLFDFWKFLFANLSKLLFTSSNELFDGKYFCENFLSFFVGLWLKFFLTYAKIRTEKVPEPIFTCSENILKKQVFPKLFLVFGTN